jgi:hypothetical protein
MLVAFLAFHTLISAPPIDPFAFFHPSITLSVEDRERLDRGAAIARIVPSEGHEVAVFVAVPVKVDGDRLVAWIRHIAALKKSSYVLAIGRFSNPPRLEDLADLVLEDEELSSIQACRPGNCGVKLSAAEMSQLQHDAAQAGRGWKPALQDAFRRVVLQRVNGYLAGGQSALPPYEHRDGPVWPALRFAAVLEHSVFLTERLPRFAEHLSRYPQTPMSDVETFVYWSKERLGRKSLVRATHVSILRSPDMALPDALVAGREIYATHYVNASLGLTVLMRGEPGAPNYLVYLNRSDVDIPGGLFRGLVRRLVQGRLKSEAADVLQGLRQRLESGEPPKTGAQGSP